MTALRVGIDAWGMSGDQLHSGFGRYTSLLIRNLPRVAPDVELVAYGGPAEGRPAWLPNGAGWRPVAAGRYPKLTAIDSRLRQLPALTAADGIDVFHAPAVHVRPSFPPVPRLPCPVVATVHDVIPLSHYGVALPLRLRAFYRWNLRRALGSTAIVTVSRAARDEIVRFTGTPGDRITVISNGVEFEPNHDTAPLRQLGLKPPYILFAGSYEPRKNLAGALEAYAQVAPHLPHSMVAIVERRSGHSAAIRRLLDQMGPAGRVRLVHSLDELTLRTVYSYADLLLFPSLAEGFGFPPLQAAACGVPVIASDLPSLRETMGDGALLVDGRDSGALARAVLSILSDDADREAIVARASSRLGLFDVETFALRHAEVYRKAAARSRRLYASA